MNGKRPEAKPILDTLMKGATVQRGYLGVGIQPLSEDLAKSFGVPKGKGELVSRVEPGEAAAKAGIKQGDIITKVDGKDETYENAAALTKAYDDVFTPGILVAIKSQTYETLFANDMGVMIGNGQVWFSEVGEGEEKAVKIIGINQP